MKEIRLFYRKFGAFRFVSHLDMVRYLTRLIRRTDLPVWYTEGFHRHLYLSFALPLPLGFTGDREAVDIRLTDDRFPHQTIPGLLNARAAEGFRVIGAGEPWQKPKEIAFCRYGVDFAGAPDPALLAAFLGRTPLSVEKQGKHGAQTVDIAPKIRAFSQSGSHVSLTLSAGNDNVNPTLLFNAFFAEHPPALPYTVHREDLLNAKGEPFE